MVLSMGAEKLNNDFDRGFFAKRFTVFCGEVFGMFRMTGDLRAKV